MNESLDFGFERILDSWRRGHHTAQPGIVQEFSDRDVPRVDVQPVFQRVFDGEDEPRTLPIIKDVPVLYPGGGGYMLTFDIPVGSQVLLIVPERALNSWMQTGDVGDPTLEHVGDLSDAIAMPGMIPTTEPLGESIGENTIQLCKRDGTVKIQINGDDINLEGGTITTSGSTETVLQDGTNWAVQYSAMYTAFNQLRTDLNNLVTIFNAHTHPYVDTPVGAATTSVTATSGTSSTVDMGNAKVDTVRLP